MEKRDILAVILKSDGKALTNYYSLDEKSLAKKKMIGIYEEFDEVQLEVIAKALDKFDKVFIGNTTELGKNFVYNFDRLFEICPNILTKNVVHSFRAAFYATWGKDDSDYAISLFNQSENFDTTDPVVSKLTLLLLYSFHKLISYETRVETINFVNTAVKEEKEVAERRLKDAMMHRFNTDDIASINKFTLDDTIKHILKIYQRKKAILQNGFSAHINNGKMSYTISKELERTAFNNNKNSVYHITIGHIGMYTGIMGNYTPIEMDKLLKLDTDIQESIHDRIKNSLKILKQLAPCIDNSIVKCRLDKAEAEFVIHIIETSKYKMLPIFLSSQEFEFCVDSTLSLEKTSEILIKAISLYGFKEWLTRLVIYNTRISLEERWNSTSNHVIDITNHTGEFNTSSLSGMNDADIKEFKRIVESIKA